MNEVYTLIIYVFVIYPLSVILCYPYFYMFYRELKKRGDVEEIKSLNEFLTWVEGVTDHALPVCSYLPVVNTIVACVSVAHLGAVCVLEITDSICNIWKK